MRTASSRTPKKYTVDKLIDDLNIEHSEELFGIEPELPYQCPRIDSFISDINEMATHISRLKELVTYDKNGNNLIYIRREALILEQYTDILKESFEELRTACDSLRNRGYGWKKLARNLFNEIPNNKRYIDKKYLDKIK